ncbi:MULTISPECIES: glycoside hydrolase family 25 protein [Enterococcus]|uniref:SH3b domain-containing protein n=1 Tax=Enterococcus sulfureus ATCC 49903 TaxID=1140003 RepID=S0NZZ7_9ENTE|nr:glycoside hydrolase family 25 protein [Enterococcus sulfureus]EOT51490.1 hypothetical protein OMY_00204 [Enterococcus sulfureus ATCC 49903]EOT87147.1 hypothetical protein I573_00203 [Enterococcus sulfureus ATCC 49903]
MIIDISEWQRPDQINMAQLAPQVTGVIIRVQYGLTKEDDFFKEHLHAFQKYQIPCAVYAWVRGGSEEQMAAEARAFYERAHAFDPVFWWLDVEEHSMPDMRRGCEVYRQTLKQLGAKKVGAYIANHLYSQFNLDTTKFDAIWMPTYGRNTGIFEGSLPTATTRYDLHQYTSTGHLAGYDGALDLNRLTNGTFEQLFGPTPIVSNTVSTQEKNEKEGIQMRTFRLQAPIYLRTKPTVTSKEITLLPKDALVRIQNIYEQEGYLWGEQPRADGSKGYLALGTFKSYGQFL